METRFYRRFRLWRLPFLISKKIKIRERRETRLLRYTDSEWQGCLNIWTVFCLNYGGTTKNRSGDLGFNNIYGIFYSSNRHFEGTCNRAGRWPGRMGRDQFARRVWQ